MPSKVIADIDYDRKSQGLTVTFVTGRTFEYIDVPAEVAASFQSAFSKAHSSTATFATVTIFGKSFPRERLAEPLRAIGSGIAKWRLPRHHLGNHASGGGAQRQTPMRVTDCKPQP
jgi:hypothetical protein